jgi:hypothetical protein
MDDMVKKKIRAVIERICFGLVIFGLLTLCNKQYIAYAAPDKEGKKENLELCYLTVSATVPKDFSSDIVVTLSDEKTNTTAYEFLLSEKDDYKKKYHVDGGKVYTVATLYKGTGNYIISGINEKGYDFSKDSNIECKLVVETVGSSSAEDSEIKEAEVTGNAVSKDDEKEVEEANVKIEEASTDELVKFIQATSFMETDSRYNFFLAQYKWDAIKTSYLTYNVTATETEWNKLTPYESFCFYYCYMLPYVTIMEKGETTKTGCLDQLVSTKSLLDTIDKTTGEVVYSACESVMLYLFNNFNQNGYFEDLYDTEKLKEQVDATTKKIDVPDIKSITVTDVPDTSANEESVSVVETFGANTDGSTNKNKELPIFSALKSIISQNWLSIIILIVILLAYGYYHFFKNKDKYGNKDKSGADDIQ